MHGLSAAHEARLTLAALKASLQTQLQTLDAATPTGLVCSVGDGELHVFGSGALVSGVANGGGPGGGTGGGAGDSSSGLFDALRAQPSEVVACGALKGDALLRAKGPDVGGQLYDWHCRKQAANALRRTTGGGGGQARGHFLLAGRHLPRLLAASLQPPPATSSKTRTNSAGDGAGLGVWAGVLRRDDVLERLRGEAAALEQWLRLAQQVEGAGDDAEAGCPEVQPQPLAAKRASLAAAIALVAVLDVGFDRRATFQVLHAASSEAPGGGGDPVAASWPLGLYLEQRGK